MKSSPRISDMTAIQFSKIAQASNSTIIIPVGATEQHGPHMPLSVDSLLSSAVSDRVAEALRAAVAPGITYGYKSQPRSGGGNHRTGTISLNGNTLIEYAKDLCNEYFRHGFKNVVFINGHYENYQFLYEGIDLSVKEQGHEVKGILLSYWDFVPQQVIERVFPDGFTGWEVEHGGVLETSLMMHLYPDLVDEAAFPNHPPAASSNLDVFPEDPKRTPDSGCLSSPTGSTADKGKMILDAVVTGIHSDLIQEIR